MQIANYIYATIRHRVMDSMTYGLGSSIKGSATCEFFFGQTFDLENFCLH